MNKKNITALSINLSHDSGAAIIVNGEVKAAMSEERINREKLTRDFPIESIKSVLNISGTTPFDIDIVLLGSQITPNWISLFIKSFHKKKSADAFSSLLYWVVREQIILRKIGLIKLESLLVQFYLNNKLKKIGIEAPIKVFDHHVSHAYSTYSSAPFDDSLVVTMDAMGDGLSCTTSIGNDGHLIKVNEMNGFCNPAFIYSKITQLLGFIPLRHEGKITGLAAYGDHTKCEGSFRKLMGIKNGKFWIKNNLKETDPILKELKTLNKEDVAAGLQFIFEEIITDHIKIQLKIHGKNNVALAGGVFTNVKLNQKIHEIEGVNNIFIYPNMGDGGTSIGAGHAYFKTAPMKLKNMYLGNLYSSNEIEDELRKANLKFAKIYNIEEKVAEALKNGKVVARFCGKMEFGPRALGNRSILYKADDVSVNDWLNKKLKRTEFMPFAPSSLIEHADKLYIGVEGAKETAKYMTITFKCTKECQINQPASVHVDLTARPQLVSEEDNPSFYNILKKYHKMTGNPSILNTSFNVHEEPIVFTPADAIKSFIDCDIDLLAIENFLVSKN